MKADKEKVKEATSKLDRPKVPIGINVFVMRDKEILLGLRKNADGSGEWGMPGGHLEYGESMHGAAARELKEETGLVSTSFSLANIVNQPSQGSYKHYIQIGFVAEDFVGEPKVLEPERCEEWRFFDVNKLPDNVFFGHREHIKLFKSGDNFVDEK